MLLRHADSPGRTLRLAYCLNLHPGDTLEEMFAGMRRITLPLRERLAPGRTFGVGMYLSSSVARELSESPSRLAELSRFLGEHGLDPFTYNAFPYGGFQADGLKQRVFEPTWTEPQRRAYTLQVAVIAAQLAGEAGDGRHLSISTHTGMHSTRVRGPQDTERCAAEFRAAASALADLERRSGWRIVLSLEAEPRANCNDTAELARFHAALRDGELSGTFQPNRYIGTCLDTCHSAVEFEEPETALANATAGRTPLGKLQYTSALRLESPDDNPAGRERLFALDEPRFLHQVTGRSASGLARVGDLPEASEAWLSEQPGWRACDEWRCHFHVPLDLEGVDGLGTTREQADRTLERTTASPDRWGTDELHVEIETYTWDVLPRAARGDGELVDGLEREYRHALERLAAGGWHPA